MVTAFRSHRDQWEGYWNSQAQVLDTRAPLLAAEPSCSNVLPPVSANNRVRRGSCSGGGGGALRKDLIVATESTMVHSNYGSILLSFGDMTMG